MLSAVGDGSVGMGGWVGSGVGRVSLVGIMVAAGSGVPGAAQALTNKAKLINSMNLIFTIFSLS
jgi:hypothetical protein